MAPARRAVARLGKRGTVAAALVLAVVLGAAAAGAQGVRREQLPNGMTVIVRESPATPVVALSLLVRIGSRWERPEEAGISNFVHAVMVKGTAQHTGAELAEAVAALGGKITAAGDVDYSGINAQALARFWRELLGLAAELALRPAVTPMGGQSWARRRRCAGSRPPRCWTSIEPPTRPSAWCWS
jgi:hypothetical protein